MMKDCYKKFWKPVLVEEVGKALPMFQLKEALSRKAADEAKPSSKPVKFSWRPVSKLAFFINFAAPGRTDDFEAWCGWAEAGSTNPSPSPIWLSDDPFRDDAFSLSRAEVPFQSLSDAAGDRPFILRWSIWEPDLQLGDSPESRAAWRAEFMAEELRSVPDKEAQQRVEAAVRKSMTDLKRCALPWFVRKLEWYLSKSRAVG